MTSVFSIHKGSNTIFLLDACAMLDENTLFIDVVSAGRESVHSPVGDAIEDDGNPSAAQRGGPGSTDGW